jgi:multidrug efflux system membrane fusion protein
MTRRGCLLALLLPAALMLIGCGHGQPKPEEAAPPEVMVSRPIREYLVSSEVFTGRTQAVNHVDLRARVTGYLDKLYVGKDADADSGMKVIKEGGDVKKGDVLFVLQQKPFVDAVTQAKNNLEQLKIQREFNRRDLARNQSSGTGVSPTDLDRAETAYRTSNNQVAAAEAALALAQQNLDWATIKAPFDGRIGKRLVDRGNDVKADDTILASIEQIDPLYAYFDVDERTALRLSELLEDGMVPPDAAEKFEVKLGLANERPENFAHRGTLLFADNKIDPGTGTLRMWGVFENPRHDLKSGMFIRVRMGLGEPQEWQCIAETALQSDQGRKYVYVVGDDNKVMYTRVEPGQRKDGLIAVKGLKGGERVVVDGLQRARPQMEVTPKEVPMPRATDETAAR